MKANLFQKVWIITQSIWTTFFFSSIILIKKNPNRKEIDAILKKWATRLLNIIKLSYEIINPYQIELKPNQSYVIMSNHASLYDIPLILVTFPHHIRMIAKKELFKVPIWGYAMKISEFIPLDRKNARQAIKDLTIAYKKIENGIIPWIAPEGTRTRTGILGQFKKGGFMIARKAKATIIPVGIYNSYDVLPPKTLDFNIGFHVKIIIGTPIDTSRYSITDQKQLIKDVEKSIRHLIDEPIENKPIV